MKAGKAREGERISGAERRGRVERVAREEGNGGEESRVATVAGWLAGWRASRESLPLSNRSRRPFLPSPFASPLDAHRGILLGQTRSQACCSLSLSLLLVPPPPTAVLHLSSSRTFPVSGRRTTGSALCGGISMGLHKPKESLGQRRVLQRYKNASLARSLSGLDNTSDRSRLKRYSK